MKSFGVFVFGVIVALLAVAACGLLTVTNGWIAANGDARPYPLEKWAAKHDLKAVLTREATEEAPIKADEENLLAGVKIYVKNCAGCHGTLRDKKPDFAQGFSPKPTLFANGDDVTDDPEGWTYWKTKHGIRWTGMPSFRKMLSEKEMWQVALFLKHEDKMPAAVKAYWETAGEEKSEGAGGSTGKQEPAGDDTSSGTRPPAQGND